MKAKIKVFGSNANGKIEFTKEQLESELQKAYDDGYYDGKNESSITYSYWTTTYTNSSDDSTYKTTITWDESSPIKKVFIK